MNVIYEDDDVLVVDKPAGVSVHPAHGIPRGETITEQIEKEGFKPFLVHRLDKDTSGVLVVAKTEEAKKYLQKQFQDREVQKTYITLVQGHLELPEAVITYPIGRNPKNPLKRAVRGSGKPSESHYRLTKQYSDASLLEVKPKTGRTHQIRVHLAHLGHPVIGDSVYGQPDPKLKRQFLHAHKIELRLPGGERKEFTSLLPNNLKLYLNRLS